MPSLLELQRRVAAALFDGDTTGIDTLVGDDGIAPLERIGVYQNNLREGFRKSLALEYPVIERLVGADYFRQLALAFLQAHPSRNGDLHHVGAPFPQFLRERFAGTEYAYFGDVAALEWAHCEVIIAADSAPLDVATLATVAPERYGELRFGLAPACRVLRSDYPVTRIWQANQPEAVDDGPIELGSGGEQLLVRRGPTQIEFHALDPASFRLLAALAAGETLGAAFDAAQGFDPEFDLGTTLRRLIALGVLVSLRLD